jgi:hypothetical protein
MHDFSNSCRMIDTGYGVKRHFQQSWLSVLITTKVGSYNITCGIVYSIQLLHDKVCLQVAACSWFLRVNQFLSIIMTAMLQ